MTSDLQPSNSFSDISHRLRNPVAGIRTTAQVLLGRLQRTEDLPESWAELVKRILKETYNIEAAISDLEKKVEPAAAAADSDAELPAGEE